LGSIKIINLTTGDEIFLIEHLLTGGLAALDLMVTPESARVESAGVPGKDSVFAVKLPLNCSSDRVEQKDRRITLDGKRG
jgi:hypothetical protein